VQGLRPQAKSLILTEDSSLDDFQMPVFLKKSPTVTHYAAEDNVELSVRNTISEERQLNGTAL